jgi:hypothetical protein
LSAPLLVKCLNPNAMQSHYTSPSRVLPLLLFFFLGFNLFGQTSAFTTSGSWLCPQGVTSIQVEAYGGGGGGGYGGPTNKYGGGGGGGGGYSKLTSVTVVPGTTYTITVGNGGIAGVSANGGNGNPSTATFGATTITANGGNGGRSYANGGNGGTGGVGTNATGGAGGTGTTSGSGGGGGAAGTTGNGGNGGLVTAGTAGGGAIAGIGGNGTSSNANPGSVGGSYGGGAGGGSKNNNGGAGAGGHVLITYGCPTLTVSAGANQTLAQCATSTTLAGSAIPTGMTGAWSVVSGAATITSVNSPTSTVTGLTLGTTATLRWTITNGLCGGTFSDVTITTSYGPACITFCTPTGSLNCTLNDYISNVTLNTLNTTSTCGAGGYTNYAAVGTQTTSLLKGSSYTLSVSVGAGTGTHGAAAWIDFNQNGVFTDAGEYFLISNAILPNTTSTLPIPIPTGAGTGAIRMRIRFTWNVTVTSAMSCTMSGTYGETEDYTLTLVAPPACSIPTAQPTGLALITGSTDITGSFTAASPAPNNYLVVINTTGTIPSPVNGVTYTTGGTFGAGNTIVDTDTNTNFIATGLSLSTTYYIYIFSFNSACTGGPSYYATTPLTDNTTTLAFSYCTPTGNLDCTTSSDYIGNVTINTLNNSSTCSASGYTNYSAVGTQTTTLTRGNTYNFSMSTGPGNKKHGAAVWVDFNQNYVFDATEYFTLGNGVIASSTNTIAIAVPAGATLGTTRMRVRYGRQENMTSSSACTMGGTRGETEDYTITIIDPIVCVAPSAQPTALILNATGTTITGSFTAPSPAPNNYLVVINTTGVAPTPANGTTYTVGSTVGTGNTVVDIDSNTAFTASGLSATTTYYLFVFSYNAACSGGPAYLTTSPLNGSATTISGNYCTPSVSSGQQSLGYLSEVSFVGTLNDVSNYSTFSSTPLGYQDFTGLSNLAIQAQSEGVNISVQALNSSFMKAWVDWNKDGDFADTGELVYDTGGISTYSATFGFIIPASQAVGNYRVRIRINSRDFSFPYDANSTDSYTSCNNINYPGETEDYLFTVVSSCSATIATVTDGRTCGSGSVALSASSASSGVTQYRWYSTPTGATLVGTSSSGTWNTPSISVTTTYYVTCYNGCESLTRTAVKATISPIPTLTYAPTSPTVCGEDIVLNLSATGDQEEVFLIDEMFTGGLGTFTNTNITSTSENATTQWQPKTSTFVPTPVTNYNVWFPAISSGVTGNTFAYATSDAGGVNVHNQMASATVNSTSFTTLTMTFRMFYSRYYEDGQFLPLDYVTVDVSTNGGGAWTEIYRYTEDIGIGTRFEKQTFDLSAYINQANLKVRVRYYGEWCDGLAIDDFELYGYRPITTALSWTSASTVNAYTDAACTISYVTGTPALNVYVKPTLAQLETGSFNFTANATLANGCTTSQAISVTNNSKIWQGFTTDWNDANNWKPLGVPTSANCVIIPSNAIISGSSYQAYAKNLTVKPTGILTVDTANNITVTDFVTVNSGGLFDFKNSSSLIQINDASVNSGSIKMTRTSRPMTRWAYIYYGSPVVENVFSQIPSEFDFKFSWQSGTQTGIWNTLTSISQGKGFIARIKDIAPFSTGTGTIDFDFTGTPGNGVVNVPVDSYDSSSIVSGNTVLLANPYPSAISCSAFLTDPSNTELGGTIFFWTSITMYSGTGIYNTQDYGSWNLSGGVGTAPATDPSNTSLKPNGRIAAGQGFFAQAFADGAISFRNSMRVTDYNTQFFRMANSQTTQAEHEPASHRIWLNLYNDTSFRQMLIGYIEGATNEFDRLYDGDSFTSNEINLYSVMPGHNLVIQGKALPFNAADVILLGYRVMSNGNYTIAIDEIDGIFAGQQQVYLKDNLLNATHDLKAGPYNFPSEIGSFDNRFEIVFNTTALSNPTVNNTDVIAFINHKKLRISAPENIAKVDVYDLTGKLVLTVTPIHADKILETAFDKADGVYLAKIRVTNNIVIDKKLVN